MDDITQSEEWAGYFLCGTRRGQPDLLLAREWCPVPEALQIKGTGHGFSWHPDFDVEMLNRMQREGLSGIVAHYHGGSDPGLSKDDRATAESLMPFLSSEVPARPHGFVVMGERALSGSVFVAGSDAGTFGSVAVIGANIDDWSPAAESAESDPRHDRLIRGFGAAAYGRLRDLRVGVVGCGGGASHVIQQLAYLGVGALTLMDRDLVEVTNLNRLVGATPARRRRSLSDRLLRRGRGDVGRLKVHVMEEMVRRIDEGIEVTAISDFFPSDATVHALRRCDVIVACVDRLQVRDDLNRFAKRYLIPMIDIGIEITPGPDFGGSIVGITGRVTKVLPAGPCLRCQGIIDDTKLEAERGGKPLGYTKEVEIPDPAVVTLNGIMASVAATEVLQLATGFAGDASPNCGWIYDGLTGSVERVVKEFQGCNACRSERALGDILP
jgi:molybdopterin-synthase adenylyltransferase